MSKKSLDSTLTTPCHAFLCNSAHFFRIVGNESLHDHGSKVVHQQVCNPFFGRFRCFQPSGEALQSTWPRSRCQQWPDSSNRAGSKLQLHLRHEETQCSSWQRGDDLFPKTGGGLCISSDGVESSYQKPMQNHYKCRNPTMPRNALKISDSYSRSHPHAQH